MFKSWSLAAISIAALTVGITPGLAKQIDGSLDLTGTLKLQGSWATPTGLTFVNNKFQVPLGDPGVGDLSFIPDLTIGNIQNLNLSAFVPITNFYNITYAGKTLQFDLDTIDSLTTSLGTVGNSLTLTGSGYFDLTGYDRTPAEFSLTTQCLKFRNGCALTAKLSFSATTTAEPAPTPEPLTISLFGGGLLGMGMKLRRRG
jgi:hypothetical protein